MGCNCGGSRNPLLKATTDIQKQTSILAQQRVIIETYSGSTEQAKLKMVENAEKNIPLLEVSIASLEKRKQLLEMQAEKKKQADDIKRAQLAQRREQMKQKKELDNLARQEKIKAAQAKMAERIEARKRKVI